MFRYFDCYPELSRYARDKRASILEQARYRAFRKKGNNAKIVIRMIVLILLGLYAKVQIDLFLVKFIGQVASGFVSSVVIFPLGYYFSMKAYSSILRVEFSDLLGDEHVTLRHPKD